MPSTSESVHALFHFSTTCSASSLGSAIAVDESEMSKTKVDRSARITPSSDQSLSANLAEFCAQTIAVGKDKGSDRRKCPSAQKATSSNNRTRPQTHKT